MLANRIPKNVQLFFFGQFAINQQVGNFYKIAVFSEFFDGVSAISQDTFFAIEERNVTSSRARINISFVDRDQSRLLPQLADIDRAFFFGTFNDWKL